MSNYNDNSDTFEFKPEGREKPQVRRSNNDAYSTARRNHEEVRRDSGNKGLIYIAITLVFLLIVVIVVGVFILSKDKAGTESDIIPENNEVVTDIKEEEKEEEENVKNENITVACSIILYSDSISKKNGEYEVKADLYDDEFYRFDSRKIYINSKTDIREDGARMSADALMYLIESMAGESIVFEGEIRESDGMVLSLKFDGSFREELEKGENEGEEIEEETPDSNEAKEPSAEENMPAENTSQENKTEENNEVGQEVITPAEPPKTEQ